jgi:hypothetical protein
VLDPFYGTPVALLGGFGLDHRRIGDPVQPDLRPKSTSAYHPASDILDRVGKDPKRTFIKFPRSANVNQNTGVFVRERILGGNTYQLLNNSPVPLLMNR